MKLHELRDNPGATKKRMRVGRGPGSGKGKTAGRGIKGQTSRSGVAIKGFEGGQMPIHMRLPKRGFNNPFKKRYAVLNLGALQSAIDAGKLDPKEPITEATLVSSAVLRRVWDGVRLLGRGDLKQPVTLEVTGASETAVQAVAKAGGTLKVLRPPKAKTAAAESSAG